MKHGLTVQCSHCKGTGVAELNGVFVDTLALLRKQSKTLSGAELAKIARCNPTAMNNRLVWLESHGFAIGERYGRERRWRATNK